MIFRDILVGWPGSVHDSRVLRNSSLNATSAHKFPGDTHLLGDGGYPLKRFDVTWKRKMVYSYFPQLLPISLVYLPLSHIFTMAVATVFYSSKIKQCEAVWQYKLMS